MTRRPIRGSANVLIFVLVTGLLTAIVAVVISDARFQESAKYHAVFSDISGLKPGDDVRVAGVSVGKVEGTRLADDNNVRVTFNTSKMPLTQGTNATIRYKNLTGDRYVDLTQDTDSTKPLPPGETIPLERTMPALDLDALFNGFKPLMRGLSPNDVNELAGSLIAVFQGQAGTVNTLLDTVASISGTLADRDEVIGTVIENMRRVLGTLDDRRSEFSDLITQLQQLISGLAGDRETIATSSARIAELAGSVTTFVDTLRPEFREATKQIGRVTSTLNTMPDYVGYNLSLIPRVIQLTGRGGSYGSFFNLYLCSIRLKLDGPDGPIFTPMVISEVPRCRFPDGKVFH